MTHWTDSAACRPHVTSPEIDLWHESTGSGSESSRQKAATLRAAGSIVEAAADREGHTHWKRIAADLHELADEMAPDRPDEEE